MSRFKIEAFVIRTTRLTESSRVVTLFSDSMGMVKGVAKGVGRPKSKMSGVFELFNLIEALLYKKETAELGTVGSAAVLDSYSGLTGEARKFGFASAWCEILIKILPPEEARPKLYNLTSELFKTMADSDEKKSGPIFWSGLVKLLGIEGYAPRLENCVSCHRDIGSGFLVSMSRGGLICRKCASEDEPVMPLTPRTLDLLRMMEAESLTSLAEGDVDKKAGKEAAEVIMAFANYHLGLPRNLKSFKFLESLDG
jgi:DNA repair protein RecO (recombination protein O)